MRPVNGRHTRRSRLGVLVGALAVALAVSAGVALAIGTADPPKNTVEPKISGTAVKGETLSVSNGTWAGTTPIDYAHQWVRCPSSGGAANGSDCAVISGATTTKYVVGTADVGRTLRVRVTASNTEGSATVATNPTAVVKASTSGAPKNTGEPRISGTPVVGNTLDATRGTWTGTKPLDFAFRWVRCPTSGGAANGSDCTAIAGATTSSFEVGSASVGKRIRVRVTASNDIGSATVASNATAVVTAKAPTPPATGCPSGSGSVQVAEVGSPARLLIDVQQATPSVVSRGTRQFTLRYHVSACGGRSVQGALVYVTAVPYNQFAIPSEQLTGSDGWAQVEMRTLSGFPVSSKQQLVAVFVRARKSGEPLLGGISTRRLFSVPVKG